MIYNKQHDYAVDKRQYFRIEDNVLLVINKLDNVSDQATLDELYHATLPVSTIENDIQFQRESYLPLLKKIEKTQPEIYAYLTYLENKIQMLLPDKAQAQSNPVYGEEHRVNISASGLRFVSKLAYQLHDCLDMRITLKPSLQTVYVFAKVVRVNERSPQHISVAVEYTQINDPNKEVLIKHIHQKQLKSLHANR